MFKFIRDWRKRRIERRRKDGFNYAAGVLLSGDTGTAFPGVEYLQGHVEMSRSFGTFDEFDCGVEDAISQWETKSHELNAVADEMRKRLVNNGKHTSPTLIAWADRIDAALKGTFNV